MKAAQNAAFFISLLRISSYLKLVITKDYYFLLNIKFED
jgi:hypothetical protein